MLFIGLDDALHQRVAHDVVGKKLGEAMPRTSPRIIAASTRPLFWLFARSIWVTSPVTTARLPKPMRVRNIFICSGVVFCASSRMMKEWPWPPVGVEGG